MQQKPPSPGVWSTSAHCTATSPLRIPPVVYEVVLRRIERRAAAVETEAAGPRRHHDPVGVVEPHVRSAQLADDIEHGRIVQKVAEQTAGLEQPLEPLRRDARPRGREVQRVDLQVQAPQFAQDLAAHEEALHVEAVSLFFGERPVCHDPSLPDPVVRGRSVAFRG